MTYIVEEKVNFHGGDYKWKEIYRGTNKDVALASMLVRQNIVGGETKITCKCSKDEWKSMCEIAK